MKKIKFLIYLITLILCISCNKNSDSVEIINAKLINEIKLFINQVNRNYPCKSDFIVLEIKKNKIYISNSCPIINNELIGICKIDNSKVIVYSKVDFSQFIKIIDNYNLNMIDENYKNKCEPAMDRILEIEYKIDGVILH